MRGHRVLTGSCSWTDKTLVLMNNCYRDYSVRNAAQLRDLLTEQPI